MIKNMNVDFNINMFFQYQNKVDETICTCSKSQRRNQSELKDLKHL